MTTHVAILNNIVQYCIVQYTPSNDSLSLDGCDSLLLASLLPYLYWLVK
jgi:hypothetical protein